MASQEEPTYSPAEYLAMERASATKHEYLNGRIYAMTGASPSHNRIVMNLSREISTQLRGRPCEAFGSDMRVKVQATGLRTYPDLSAPCGPPRFDTGESDSLVNPGLLIEVISPSTESYDRGEKFEHYRQIPTLREYVLFEQDRSRAEYRVRNGDSGDRWGLTVVRGLDATLEFPAIGCVLSLRDVYERLELLPDSPLRAVYEHVMFAGFAANQTST